MNTEKWVPDVTIVCLVSFIYVISPFEPLAHVAYDMAMLLLLIRKMNLHRVLQNHIVLKTIVPVGGPKYRHFVDDKILN